MGHAFGSVSSRRGGGVRPRLLDFEVVTPSAEDPVTLAEAKEWLRVDGTDQDATITALISAATEWAENFTRRAFVDRSLDVLFETLPPPGLDIYLPQPPVPLLTAVVYETQDGTLIPIVVDTEVEVRVSTGLVRELVGFSWPTDVRDVNFQYTAGYGPDATTTPEEVKTAIKIAVAQMFETRVDQTFGAQASVPQVKSSMALLRQFRVGDI